MTDDPSAYSVDFIENVEGAVAGGVSVVQYRDTQSSGRMAYERAKRLKAMLDIRGIPLIVNNDVALALAIDAAGVHVGGSDLPAEVARKLLPERMSVGLSVTSLDGVSVALKSPADVFGAGPVWDARKTKTDAADATGTEVFGRIVEALLPRPTVAIGGITPANAKAAVDAGAKGLAVVSAFSRSNAPEEAAAAFRKLFRK